MLLLCLHSCKQQHITLVYNAKIYTVDDNFSIAQAMALCDGKIIAIGSEKEVREQIKNAQQQINAKGKYIFPGFIDAHCHFTGYATNKQYVHLEQTTSWEEVLLEIKKSTPHNHWIIGRGWDNTKWANKNFPTNKELNRLFPNTPVVLRRIDGHALLCNDTVLRLAKINTTTNIEGGQILKNDTVLTGILIDNAMDAVLKLFPKLQEQETINFFNASQKDCFAFGLTSIVDCGVEKETFEQLKKAYIQKKLKIRTTVLLSDNTENYNAFINATPYKDDNLHIAGFKVYADGSLGSRGACLLHDYHDAPHHKGTLLKSVDSILSLAQKIILTPYQMCTHAIGDSANRAVLKIYGGVLKKQNDRRWRIEHSQVVDKNDFHLFKLYSIIPSVQPTHATSDMDWAQKRLGTERLPYAYAYKQLLLQNNWLPLGTDFPVEDLNPLKTFYAAVFRKNILGVPNSGFLPENALSREQALKGITIWAAKSVFEEKEKGSLQVGKLADFVILDTDIMHCSEKNILTTKVISTYVGGQKVF